MLELVPNLRSHTGQAKALIFWCTVCRWILRLDAALNDWPQASQRCSLRFSCTARMCRRMFPSSLNSRLHWGQLWALVLL